MRSACLFVALFLLTTIAITPGTQAQTQTSQNVTLYARSDHGSHSLSAAAPTGPQQSEDVGTTLNFTLNPPLGGNLQISGAIFVTVFLHAGALVSGTLHVQVVELKSTGEQVPIPGATIDSPISLDITTHPFNSGVGIINYEFKRGSSIQLQVRANVRPPYPSPFFTPIIVWNAPGLLTSLTLPAVQTAKANLTVTSDLPHFGRIFSTVSSTGRAQTTIAVNVTDPIGLYRFTGSTISLSAQNGTSVQLKPTVAAISNYSAIYSQTAQLSQGHWVISLRTSDASGNTYTFDTSVWVTPFYDVKFYVTDSSTRPVMNASMVVTFQTDGKWTGVTNATGFTTMSLPASDIVGPLNLTVIWNKVQIEQSTGITTAPSQMIRIIIPIYDVTIRLTTNGFPLPYTRVWLVQGIAIVAQGSTGLDGTVAFTSIPAGNYTFLTYFLTNQYQEQFNVKTNAIHDVDVPLPYRNEIVILLIALVGSCATIVATRRGSRVYPHDFSHFDKLTMGGLPDSCFTLIAGNSGSGKSVLLESLAAEHMKKGQGSVYIINTEYPSKIRESMITLGMPITEVMKDEKLLFIDSYSAVGGTPSKEDYSVSSHTDLTGLGMKISKCIEQLGPSTDVFFDSIMPLLTVLRVDYLMNFLQSVAAKVKANGGKLIVTVGTGIEKNDLVKLEEASDCIIETQLQESRKGQNRRLRIRKLRGKAYNDKWVNFRIETGKGIVFLTRTRSEVKNTPQIQS
jgi:KaiC/GvpD/RAD55 family RecA-like ATPase